jgi:hypothetical protein
MSKASKKRQKLTQEELKAENKKLRNEIAQGYINKEDSERIVQMLSTQNLIAYAIVLFLPPVGIWYIWTRREKLHLTDAQVYLWTFVGLVILYQYIIHFVLGR